MKKNIVAAAAAVVISAVMILPMSGCGEDSTPSSYKDGTYTGRSADREADEDGNGAGYGEVQITVKDNKITECTFKTYELDGTLKDETYGADLTKENRLKAQKAVQSADKYADFLVKSGSLDGVDAISGATISYGEFKEAVNNALSKAAE